MCRGVFGTVYSGGLVMSIAMRSAVAYSSIATRTYATMVSPVSFAIAILRAASLALLSKPNLATPLGLDCAVEPLPSRKDAARLIA